MSRILPGDARKTVIAGAIGGAVGVAAEAVREVRGARRAQQPVQWSPGRLIAAGAATAGLAAGGQFLATRVGVGSSNRPLWELATRSEKRLSEPFRKRFFAEAREGFGTERNPILPSLVKIREGEGDMVRVSAISAAPVGEKLAAVRFLPVKMSELPPPVLSFLKNGGYGKVLSDELAKVLFGVG